MFIHYERKEIVNATQTLTDYFLAAGVVYHPFICDDLDLLSYKNATQGNRACHKERSGFFFSPVCAALGNIFGIRNPGVYSYRVIPPFHSPGHLDLEALSADIFRHAAHHVCSFRLRCHNNHPSFLFPHLIFSHIVSLVISLLSLSVSRFAATDEALSKALLSLKDVGELLAGAVKSKERVLTGYFEKMMALIASYQRRLAYDR